MNIYVDDDTVDRSLVALLRKAGHAVRLPSEVGTAGVSDARHFIHAMRHGLIVLTRNHKDYADLHDVVQAARGTHLGILTIRSDNDPTRDMTPRGIVAAIKKIESAGVELVNQCYVLNHWR